LIRAYVRVLQHDSEIRTYNLDSGDIYYPPPNSAERAYFRTEDGKKVSDHAWAVYDYIRGIPVGKVTTYKVQSESSAHPVPAIACGSYAYFRFMQAISDALGEGSPRTGTCPLILTSVIQKGNSVSLLSAIELNDIFLFAFI